MFLLRTFAAACLAASLSACIIVDADLEEGWDDDHSRGAMIYGAEVGVRAPEVTITVHSNGCTEKSHFDARVNRHGRKDVYTVSFRRVVEDHCKALVPEGRRLTWTYPELGLPHGAQIVIGNPVGR